MTHESDSYNEFGDHSSSGVAHTVVPKSLEEARHQYEQMKSNNLNALRNIEFETDEKGQTSYLGLPISKDMKPMVELAVDSVKPLLISQSEKIYNGVSGLAYRIGFTKSHSTIGSVVENMFRWGIVGTVQILDTVRASNKAARERQDLFTKLTPVMQSTGATLHNNEVIKVAYDDIHANWVSEMKKVMADIPSLIPAGAVAWQEQVASNARRKARKVPPAHADAGHSEASSIITANQERATRWLEEDRAMDTAMAKERERINGMPEGSERTYAQQALESSERQNKEYRDNRWSNDHSASHDVEETKKKDSGSAYDKVMYIAAPFASLFSQKLKSNINEEIQTRKKRVRAWKMIEQLKLELDGQCGEKRFNDREGFENCEKDFRAKSPDDIMLTGMGNRDGDQVNLREFVVELFQQHERDREPNRDFYNKKTGKAVDPLKGNMLANLKPSVDLITENLANGTISPDALYKLVGENRVIQHSASGARVFVKQAELQNYIDKELAPVLGTREVTKPEEFMAKFANPALIEDTLKKNLAAMQGLEKAIFASLFPDDILEHAGVKKKEITELRKRAHEHAYDFVAASVMYLSKKTPEELKAMGVSEKETTAISSLADRLNEGDMKALKLAVDGHDKEVVDAVRTAGLLEQVKDGGKDGGDRKFWTERVKEMSSVRNQLQKKHSQAQANAPEAEGENGHSAEKDEHSRKFQERAPRRSKSEYRTDSFDSPRADAGHSKDKDYDTGSRNDWPGDDTGGKTDPDRSSEGLHASRVRSRNNEISRDAVRGGAS